MAPTFVVACTTTRRHCAPQLNSGVRLLGSIPVGFKNNEGCWESGFVSSRHISCSKRFSATQKPCRCRSKRLAVSQKHWFVAADRANVWVRIAPNSFAHHALAAEAAALGYNGSSNRLQPNKSFKLMSLRGADFCGSVYHNAAPLRATA